MTERPVSAVPRAILAFLAVALAAQLALKAGAARPSATAEDLPPVPSIGALRLASFGEPVALAKGLMLYLQAFDYQSGTRVPYRDLDYDRVEAWLAAILELDPSGQYPLLAASRLYAEVPDEAKQRSMLEFIYRQFLVDPDRRWPWLAHATVIAKHRLHDLPLALRFARAIERLATAPDVPLWARQMQAFILEDMNELDAARLVIGGYVSSGKVKDPGELRFLDERLEELERQTRRGLRE
jgi:hypothetical protein